jgi:hypothetical protein
MSLTIEQACQALAGIAGAITFEKASTRNEIFELLRHGFNPANVAEPQSIDCRYFLECISVHPATTSDMKVKIG